MKILVDENVPRKTVDHLTGLGHDVADLRGTPAQGITDAELWALAVAEQRLLITTDRGFANHRHSQHAGILIVRLRQPNRERIHNTVVAAFSRFSRDDWPNMLVVARDTTLSVSHWGGEVRYF